jgi:N-acetylmuramoyl-L-alanine amidase
MRVACATGGPRFGANLPSEALRTVTGFSPRAHRSAALTGYFSVACVLTLPILGGPHQEDSMWPNFDGKPYTRDQLAARINACDFSTWKHKDGSPGKPAFITLHNTSTPDIKLWQSWAPAKRQQYILNMQPYYENMGWRGGPHFFVPPQTDICAFGFNDLMAAGTHASCFNNVSIGIEMVGEFDSEAFDSGPGAQVADNAIYLMALLHNKIGLTPTPYAYNRFGLHFHVECKADNHDCPGKLARKPDIVARVKAKMAELAGPPPAIGTPPADQSFLSETAAPTSTPILPQAIVDQICSLAAASGLASVDWKSRGRAPLGYIKGMAVVFGLVCAKLKAGDPAASAMAAADSGKSATDALSWYQARFNAAGMSNAASGVDTLRHLFVLLIGLGMRESSGRYCEGRDISADNVQSDTAEAGAFQTSWNLHTASPLLPKLFADYTAKPDGFLSIFQEGVVTGHNDLANFGDGDGAAFQQLCKSCPAFAAQFAAVGLRVLRTHWGPIKSRAAEVRAEADALLQQVQAIVP